MEGTLKNRSRDSDKEKTKRQDFQEELDMLFDISVPNVTNVIQADRLRTPEAKQSDIEFYNDQKGARIGKS